MESNLTVIVEGLVKNYGNLTAVDHVSFTIHAGEVYSLVGPNGAGKTTTVEILECLRKPSSGKAYVLGFDVSDTKGQKEIRKRIGVLPQEFNTFELLTVKESIEYFAEMYDSEVDAEELIKLADLESHRNAYYKTLSGGLKQRLGVAISLVNDPEVVFLDEPTTGLDPKARRGVWDVIRGLKERGKTVLLTTHYMEEAEALSDRVGIILAGKIVAEGKPKDLVSKFAGPQTLVVVGGGESARRLLDPLLPDVTLQPNGDVIAPIHDKVDLTDATLALSSRRAEFDALEIRSPSLEDAFLRLTGKKMVEGELR